MKILFPFLVLLLLGGCMTPRAKTPTGHPTATGLSAPGTIGGIAPIATLEVHRANAVEFFTGYEARCQILSIDGAGVEAGSEMTPGNHTLTVLLNHLGLEYTGDVDLVIPEAKGYELRAKRKGDTFMLSIVDVAAAKTIATSTAPIKDHMKFLVFVVQK